MVSFTASADFLRAASPPGRVSLDDLL